MPGANQTCTKIGPALHRTVAVGIDLIGFSAVHSHQVLSTVLEDKKIQLQLAEALKKAGQELMAEQNSGKHLTLDDTLSKIGTAADGIVRVPVKNQYQRSAEFQRLESSLQQLKCAFDQTPVGAFVNENKTLLVIIGSVAAIGGGVAMYQTKAGDVPAKAFSLLPSLTPISIGSVDITLQNFELKPSERKVAFDAGMSGKWSRVEARLNLGATFAHDDLTRAAGSGKLTLYLGSGWQGTAGGAAGWSRDSGAVRSAIYGSAELGIQKKLSNTANVSMQLFGTYADGEKGMTNETGIRGNLAASKVMGGRTKLTLSPSYTVKTTQARDEFGPGPARTDRRVFVNLKLEFDLP
jgi:hypothetical protein